MRNKPTAIVHPYEDIVRTSRIQRRGYGTWQRLSNLTPLTDVELSVVSSIKSEFRDVSHRINEIAEMLKVLREKAITYSVKIYDLNSEKCILKYPVDIVLEKYDDEVIARFPELEVFGSGNTESESLIELKREILDLYADLESSGENELGPLPQMWKRILRQIILEK